jgi:glycosyltransferase involved in cell wall biosynthesis
MKVCLVGDFSENLDEGMKGVAHYLTRELAKMHRTLKIDIRRPIELAVWCKLKDFRPDVVHYFSGPSPFSFVVLQTLLFICRVQSNHEICSVMSATQPWLPLSSVSFLAKLKPDLLLVQSIQSEAYFRRMDFFTKYLPNGVDVEKFRPADENLKKALRGKYGLKEDEFIVLHVGPIRANRGLHVLKSVAGAKNCKVLLVGSTSSSLGARARTRDAFLDLKRGGCIIWRKYIEPIQEIYQLSDLYVFPVQDRLGSIETPLSVLEAMSCNLPVIATRFGGLTRMFNEGDGLYFVCSDSQILELVEDIRSKDLRRSNVHTRSKVLPYSWRNISKSLSKYYCQLFCSGK